MKEMSINLWDVEADVICITTNGTVRNGRNVMGGGCAREAAELAPGLPGAYATLIERHGNHVFVMGPLVLFPVKHRVSENADVELIARSVHELKTLADLYGWTRVALPRPGCGLGGLSWEADVRPWLSEALDDRFIIIDFPRPSWPA
jgi:O-acetyl-ADP-ribose deacetylase (regulator of RNase III)